MMNPLILIHILLSSIIWFVGKNKINKQERFCNFIIAFFFPFGGFLAVLILYFSRHNKAREIDSEEDIDNAYILFTDRLDIEKDINIVPLEETLIINDTKEKRRQLIEVLKKDSSEYIDMLKIAVRDNDVETSHYAAAAIAEIKRNLDFKLQSFSVEFEKNKSDIKLLKGYADVLEEYIDSGLIDDFNKRKIAIIYIEVLEYLIENYNEREDYYNKLIKVLFEADELEKAEKYCKDFLENYGTEDAFLASLKYYYRLRDKEKFEKTFKRLLNSPIKLSNKGLNIVRFWLEGV